MIYGGNVQVIAEILAIRCVYRGGTSSKGITCNQG
ncbi:hypothetical protein CPT_Phriendly_001 [Vibrio phage Phriendly]|nr:hypothetical protein CPT_Phriendly_001 [Vibrio phage Phriendly]